MVLNWEDNDTARADNVYFERPLFSKIEKIRLKE
jgi:hypothetical protein